MKLVVAVLSNNLKAAGTLCNIRYDNTRDVAETVQPNDMASSSSLAIRPFASAEASFSSCSLAVDTFEMSHDQFCPA